MRIGLTGHVRVLTGRQVDSLDQVQVREQLERPEDGCAADGALSRSGGREDVLGGEMAVLPGDRVRDGSASDRQALPRAAESGDQGIGCGHRAGAYSS